MTESYVSLYLNTAFSENGGSLLALMFLCMGRILPIIVLVPFFGSHVLPRPVKVTFALSLFVIFLPQLIIETKTQLTFDFYLILILLKEILIGILIGFFINIPFAVVQNTGVLIDHQRGSSSLMTNDPVMQNQSSPLGTLFNYILIYFFFMIDGPFLVLDIISQSYMIVPPDKMLNPTLLTSNSQFIQHIIKIVGNVMILSTQLAAPALIMILMTDFFLGIANRLAPQVQITFLGMPLKSLLALTIVFFGWTLFNQEIVNQAYKTLNYVANLIQQFQILPDT